MVGTSLLTKFKPTKAQKAFIERTIKKWIDKLHLNLWVIDKKFCSSDTSGDHVHAEIHVNCIYSKAEIDIFPNLFSLSKEAQEQAIIHELVHCLLAEPYMLSNAMLDGKLVTQAQLNDSCESTTQKLTMILFKNI